MIWSFFLNGIIGFVMLITFLFCIPDINAILDPEQNPSGFPVVYVFQQASYYGCIPLLVLILMVVLAGSIDSNCSTSRQMFAFARDGGLPFKKFLTMVSLAQIRQKGIFTLTVFSKTSSRYHMSVSPSLQSSSAFCP
jgi:amino acid transporter